MYPPDLPLHALSSEQCAVLAHDRRWRRSGAFHPSLAALTDVRLDRERLAAALDRLAVRHDALRTTFHDGPQGPMAALHPHGVHTLAWTDRPGALDDDLREIARREVFRPFDVARSAFRFVVVAGRDSTLLQLTAQHAATDARSNWMLLDQLLAEYAAGHDAPGQPPAGSFFPFAAAEAAVVDGPSGDEIRRRHRERLRGAVTTELLTDRPRPAASEQLGATVKVAVEGADLDAVRRAAQECEVTLYAYLLACFEAFLVRSVGEPDVVLGCVVSARTPRMRDVVGFFANVVPVRCAPAPAESFRSLARRAADDVRDAVALVRFPGSRLIAEGILPPTRSGLTGCRVKFNYLGSARPEPLLDALLRMDGATPVRAHGLDLRVVELPQLGGAHVDLAVHVLAGSGRVLVEFRYDPELFLHTTMQRLAQRYVALLRAAADDVDRPALGCPGDEPAARLGVGAGRVGA